MKQKTEPPNQGVLGIDVGGTFIDIVMRLDNGREESEKLLAEPDRLVETITRSVARLLERSGVAGQTIKKVVHATTRGSNAVLERKGPDVALLTTRGFRDVLQIGRALRWSMYDVQMDKPRPLVPRSRTFEITERCLADGTVRDPLDEAEVLQLAGELKKRGIGSAAVAFLHAYLSPEHEQRARDILQAHYPELLVTLSSDVSRQGREYERTSTAVVNAYLVPVLADYLNELAEALPMLDISAPLWVMQSSGGLVSAEQAAQMPVRTLESGPAAGVLASAEFGAACGYNNVISFDMGGTTAKAAVVEDGIAGKAAVFELERVQNRRGSGLPVDISAIDLVEIGTGGGSIAESRLGVLQVGPQSAGAEPGPACYGRGGVKATVTDANLVLGYLNAANFAGGTMQLDAPAAEKAMDSLAAELGLDRLRTAWGIHQLANLEMERALRLVSIDRGFDPRDFALVCIGGAAPAHGSRLARALGIGTMIVPPGAGVGSAVGLLEGNESVELARSSPFVLEGDDTRRRANAMLDEMEESARNSLEAAERYNISLRRSVGMRYLGQGYELNVMLEDDGPLDIEKLCESFHQRYERNYGYREAGLAVEAVTWYLTLTRERQGKKTAAASHAAAERGQAVSREIYMEDLGFCSAEVIQRSELVPGENVAGPAVIEEAYTTTLVLPGDRLRLDDSGALVITTGVNDET